MSNELKERAGMICLVGMLWFTSGCTVMGAAIGGSLDRPDLENAESDFERSPDKWVEWEHHRVWIVRNDSLLHVRLEDVDLAAQELTVTEQPDNSVGQADEHRFAFSTIEAVGPESSRYTIAGTVLGLTIDIATVAILLSALEQRPLH